MTFDDTPALMNGFDKLTDDVNGIAEDLTIEPNRAFETWAQRVAIPDWLEDRGYEIEWPSDIEDSQAIGEEGGELSLDIGMVVSKDEDGNGKIFEAVVCQCYFPDDPEDPGSMMDKANEVNTAISSLTQTNENDRRNEFISELEEKSIVYKKGEEEKEVNRDRIIHFFVTTGKKPQIGADATRLRALENEGLVTLDGTKLSRKEWLKLHPEGIARPEELEMAFVSCVDETVDGVALGIVSAKELHDFFTDDRENSPWYRDKNQSLLDDNLRYKLAEDELAENISQGMIDTMSGENQSNFIKYNNGIVIVTEGFELDDGKVVMKSPNIVNGGQTTNAVFESVRNALVEVAQWEEDFAQTGGRAPTEDEKSEKEKETIPDGHIYVKVVDNQGDANLTKEVARYANKQNPIEPRDQRASDSEQQHYHDLLKGADNYIFFDHKRGMWERTPGATKAQFNVSGNQFRKLDNTKCMQNYLAMIGAPEVAYKSSDGLWANDPLVDFVFSNDRSATLQIATNITSITEGNGATARDIMCIRDGLEEFAKDMILCDAITAIVKAIKGRREKKKNHVKTNVDEEAYKLWFEETTFHSNWTFAVIRAFNMIIHKHCESAGAGEVASKRQEIREALLRGEFWMDKALTGHIFRAPASWTGWVSDGTPIEDTNHTILPSEVSDRGEICTQFPLLGFWLAGIEEAARGVATPLRDNAKFFKTREFYEPFEAQINTIINDPNRMAATFPLAVPVASEEFHASLAMHERNFDSAKNRGNRDRAEQAIAALEQLPTSNELQETEKNAKINLLRDDLNGMD